MANRKFNLGRQGEQLMNDKVFKSYNRIKYIGNGLDSPKQEYQTPILDYSLWINRTTGSDVMHVYDQTSKVWNPMFQGYYHPANLKEQPLFPVDGQIFIDNNGVLRYYEDKQWKIVAAASADDSSAMLMGLDNFILMPNMTALAYSAVDYIVPSARVGKLFDNKKFVIKDKFYDKDMRITYPINGNKQEELLSWVHVNPAYLSGARKRLIKVLDSMKDNNYFISTPTLNTEFYGFKEGNPLGTLMRYIPDYNGPTLTITPNIDTVKLEDGHFSLLETGNLVTLEEQEGNDFNVIVNPKAEGIDNISDYRVVSGGIELMNKGKEYDFIYAITYKFDTVEDKPGTLITGSSVIKEDNQIYIGQIGGYPLVFLGGLYYDSKEYTYDRVDGVLTFVNESMSFYYDPIEQEIIFKRPVSLEVNGSEEMTLDNGNAPIVLTFDEVLDSIETYNEITESADLVVAAFADVIRYELDEYPNTERQQRPPFEFEISSENVDANGDLYIQHEYIKQAAEFKHPIVFVQGVAALYDEEYGIIDEIELNTITGEVWVKNFGPKDPSTKGLKLTIADIGDAKLSSGYAVAGNDSSGRIVDERIHDGGTYLVFVNGVLTSPTDHDIVADGYMEIHDMLEGTQYFLMSLEAGEKGIDLLFDSHVAYHTFRIEDDVEGVAYNDCDMVVSYISGDDQDDYNGLLIDRTMLQVNDLGEESYSTGEIIYVRDTNNEDIESYVYKIFNVNGDFEWTKYADEFDFESMQVLNAMALQMNTEGSISVMGASSTNVDFLQGKKVNYLAYTYADETDEPILKGSTLPYKYAIKGHAEDAGIPEEQDFYVRRIHYYTPPNKGILSTFVNGLHVRSYDSSNVECKYHIPTHENLSFIKSWGNECDLYNLIKVVDSNTDLEMLKQMKEGEFSEELKNFSICESLLERLQGLHNTLFNIETNNRLDYFVERIEQGEQYSADKQWCTHANRYVYFDNTYTGTMYFGPGNVDIYLNGVMLDRQSYSIFDSNKVILNDLSVAGGSDEYDSADKESHKLIKYYIKEYDEELGRDVGRVEKIYCESPDEILIEYKPDTSIRKTSYELKEVTYDTGILSYDDYEFPNSLLNTKDEIKIWIDGILYTGGYSIKNKDIILKDNPLQLDPIKLYFDSHPDTYKEWKEKNGEYTWRKSRIIFEWR